MEPIESAVGPSSDEQARQDLEDMRAELLHEMQDGDEMEDERVEVVSLQVARIRRRPNNRSRALQTIPAAASLAQVREESGPGRSN